MSWYEDIATRLELRPENTDEPKIRPTQLVMHSITAPWTVQRLYEYWQEGGVNLESTFGVDYSGAIGQYMDTGRQADAQYHGNLRPDGTGALSVETASNKAASDPWTDAQVDSLVRLVVAVHRREGIPIRLCRTDSDPGIGYHKQFPEWNPNAHDCPGDLRIAQLKTVILPRAAAQAAAEENDMPTYQHLEMKASKPLTSGTWSPVAWDTEHYDPGAFHGDGAQTFFGGQGQYTGTVALEFTGVPVGQQVQARVVADDAATGETVATYDIDERAATPGATFLVLPLSGRCGPGQRVKVQVLAFGGEGDTLVLRRAVLRTHIWPGA